MKLTGSRPDDPAWVALAAGALLLGGPVAHYLLVNQYPITRPEAVALPAAAALAGAMVSLAAWRIAGWLGTLVFAALVFLFIDVQFDLHRQVQTLVIIAVCIALSQLLWRRRATIVCITLGAFYLAGLVPLLRGTEAAAGPLASSRSGARLPLVVHIILDEQWGTGGFRGAGDTTTAEFLEKFYMDRGFELYAGAYSRWAHTLTSIPAVVNLGRPYSIDSVSPARFGLQSNAYFARLRDRGYRIAVYQSTFLDYCHTPGAQVECDEASANSIANFGYFRGSWIRRAMMAGRYYLNVTSHAYVRLHRDAVVWRRSGAGGGLRQLARVRDRVASRPQWGTVLFAHVLLPHRPTDVDAECRAHADHSRRIGYEENVSLTDSVFREHLALYAAQTRCAHRAVADVVAAVDSTVGRDGSIVIIHGDHGSRMSRMERSNELLAGYDAGRLNSVFSTLLAVRRPGIPPAVYRDAVPTQDFLWHLIGTEFQGRNPGAWRHYVRAPATNGGQPDTLRELRPSDMLWAGMAGIARGHPGRSPER